MKGSADLIYMRCIIYGKVQGVFFRASTRDQAKKLGILGYARNMPDGCVEVIACGTEKALSELKAWLHVGPRTSTVTSIDCETISEQQYTDFNIL